MIKLKKLIEEVVNYPTTLWKTPSGTPDEVINVLHLIIAEIRRSDENTKDYLAFHSYGKVWLISHKKDKAGGLLYNEDTKQWYSTSEYVKGPLTPLIINTLIKGWVK